MNPKKPKELIKQTAEKLKLDEALVDDVVRFYWKEVRKGLTDLKAPRVLVANFGSFRLKHWMLDEEIKKCNLYLDNLDPENMTFHKHRIKKDVESRIEMINQVKEQVNKDLQKKQEIKEKRNNESKGNME